MKIRYDADAMYIRLKESKTDHSKKIDKSTIIDYDKKGEVISIEIFCL